MHVINHFGRVYVASLLQTFHKDRTAPEQLTALLPRVVRIVNKDVALFSLAGCETLSGKPVVFELDSSFISVLN